ncbi:MULTISPECIES: NCS1 family nucleobase:cation symporter-1 [unclassified Modestobacter]|uniref:NCS1 family nucleobase:cation symporter-1 n=1 Tax=unclassified Modestobacter TaxID=2643866 RepID=UPI0022AA32E5|nr:MULTISPECIES: NCS1 family nucleobase:cation symporter-1 [unclassified Modestobacter]MCZ2824320.1 NCS1 family nucleobase:cation symporter-1 [Modestobacter sp. VKM Ac-2981]MCZ2854152.1 NCS1 family nucleobase:cation symporter-1 [Modestobacter sp. VKM Ac-2982]
MAITSPEPVALATDLPPTGTAPSAAAPGGALIGADYDPRLTNEDLAPLRQQRWGSYNIFAFWMSDVHSVGGYVTAGSLFALGIAAWQVLVALVVGIVIVQVFVNLVAKPSQMTGVPYPVINRAVFGVKGANIPAIIRGLIAVAWYGVQTFLAASSLNIIWLKFVPGAESLLTPSFLGLEALGWISFAVLWVAQAALFWRGMETIRKFIDFAGPAVYVVMIVLAVYLVSEAGWSNIDLSLHTGPTLSGWATVSTMLGAIALVVSYFSGPMLNFGDFARYGKSFAAVKRGNLLGLPLNFLFFSLLTVVCASATVPVFGELITDPIATVEAIDSTFAILLGGLTFVIATVGINIVANFIAPAFDFSNVAPQKISWRAGGMIAAVGSVLLTPWNWYDSAEGIRFSLGILGSLIGPLFGILIAGYYLASKQRVAVDDMYSMSPTGRYWFRGGYNPNAVIAVLGAGVPTILLTLFTSVGDYGWFIGCGLGFVLFAGLERVRPMIVLIDPAEAGVSDGTRV